MLDQDDAFGLQSLRNAEQRGGTAENGKPSMTIEQAGLHLIGGEPGWSAALGVPATVTYGYRTSAPSDMPDDTGGFSRFNAAQIAQSELALQAWSDVANITFVRVGTGNSGEQAYSNSASILFANYATGAEGAAAFGNYPGNYSFSSASGDVWVNSTLSYNNAPTARNYGGLVLVHEIGHTIGLAHPGDYDASEDGEITYAHDAEYFEDSLQYTVMSYFDEIETGANFKGAYGAVPMLDDISAAQQEYGANLATRTGDTVYGFNSTADRPWFAATGANSTLIFAVWDAGGVDTFDFSGFAQGQTIDLQAGHFSNVGGLVGNVAIAANVGVENAIGGSGVDIMYGNGLGNRLEGGLGADTLLGLNGDDVLIGGLGDDQLDGGAGIDTASYASAGGAVTVTLGMTDPFGAPLAGPQNTGAAGFDVLSGIENLTGSAFGDTLYGGAGANWLSGGGGNDGLSGGAGDDVLDGGTGQDYMVGGAGNDSYIVDDVTEATVEAAGEGTDVVYAASSYGLGANIEVLYLGATGDLNGVGNDIGNTLVGNTHDNYLTGLAGPDALLGGDGNDHEYGGDGEDYLYGQNGDDWLVGDAGFDHLYGEAGVDVLIGGAGDDLMAGGVGDDGYLVDSATDLIVENAGEGADVVYAYASYTLAANVENLWLFDGANGGSGNASDNLLVANLNTGSTLYGLAGADALVGENGDDALYGGTGNDFLNGQAGNDVLVGGQGSDLLYGGAGVDTFLYAAASDSVVAGGNMDAIMDFQIGIDKVNLHSVMTGPSDIVSLVANGDGTYILIDLGGNGTEDMRILLYQTYGVTHGDILT